VRFRAPLQTIHYLFVKQSKKTLVKGVVYFVAKILKKVEITKEKEVRTDWSEVYKEKQRNDSHKEPKKERKEKNINSAILLRG
jgi:hypothetical protein